MAQLGYSLERTNILDQRSREKAGTRIARVIEFHTSNNLSKLYCLDVGCSAGIITRLLAGKFRKIVGVDVDKAAIGTAKKSYKTVKNMYFLLITSEQLPFKSETFDVVICNQVYNFVDSPRYLMDEIYRVLRPGGICYFSGRNKLSLIEPQYKLPFLSLLNLSLGRKYITITGRGKDYNGRNYLTYWGLKHLTSKFEITDFTLKILEQPFLFNFENLTCFSNLVKLFPKSIITPFIPNYIWVLKKP